MAKPSKAVIGKTSAPSINIGISDKDRAAIAQGLSRLLADTYTLYLTTHNFHWNVTGPMFNTLHTMFMAQYTELWNAVDPIAERIHGRRGVQLAEHWRSHGAAAYKGTTVPGFPNMFQITGPNTVLGHTSMIEIIEAQIGYIIAALGHMDALGLAAIEPKENATLAYNHQLRMALRKTIWNTGGCSSWYLDEAGRNTVVWPRTAIAYVRQMSHFDAASYNITDTKSSTHEHSPTH